MIPDWVLEPSRVTPNVSTYWQIRAKAACERARLCDACVFDRECV